MCSLRGLCAGLLLALAVAGLVSFIVLRAVVDVGDVSADVVTKSDAMSLAEDILVRGLPVYISRVDARLDAINIGLREHIPTSTWNSNGLIWLEDCTGFLPCRVGVNSAKWLVGWHNPTSTICLDVDCWGLPAIDKKRRISEWLVWFQIYRDAAWPNPSALINLQRLCRQLKLILHDSKLEEVNYGDSGPKEYSTDFKKEFRIISQKSDKCAHKWLLAISVIVSCVLALFCSGCFLIYCGRYGGGISLWRAFLFLALTVVFVAHAIITLLKM